MFDEAELTRAVDLQSRTYRFLMWMDTAITACRVTIPRAHATVLPSDAVADWIRTYFQNLPPDCRPVTEQGRDATAFANMLASYLVTSFDVVDNPGEKWISDTGCACPVCVRLVAAPHLKAKHLTKSDKHRAAQLKAMYLQELAAETESPISPLQVARLLEDNETSEKAALAAYGVQLLRRMQGDDEGPAVLALWREFAWLPTGSPKKGFKLAAPEILRAEKELMLLLGARGSHP